MILLLLRNFVSCKLEHFLMLGKTLVCFIVFIHLLAIVKNTTNTSAFFLESLFMIIFDIRYLLIPA